LRVRHNKFHVTQDEPHRWRNIEELVYKDEDGAATFKAVTRRVLFGEDHHDGMEVRYFEVDAGGHTTLEKHEHTHLVIPIKGKGACLVGDKVLPLAIHDLVYVPSWAWHQFRADEKEPLGFLCLVKVERDRPTLPTADELTEMKSVKEVSDFIRHQ
jgi:quercetin dioxygenase-like cupin family protein